MIPLGVNELILLDVKRHNAMLNNGFGGGAPASSSETNNVAFYISADTPATAQHEA